MDTPASFSRDLARQYLFESLGLGALMCESRGWQRDSLRGLPHWDFVVQLMPGDIRRIYRIYPDRGCIELLTYERAQAILRDAGIREETIQQADFSAPHPSLRCPGLERISILAVGVTVGVYSDGSLRFR